MREPVAPARTLSGAVYAEIRSDILAGRYTPGSKLSPRVIATQSKVSLSVVREALTRLTEQGLVISEPQLGFSVVGLDIDDVRDLSRVRILIEGAALKNAVLNADVEYEAGIVASHHRMVRNAPAVDDGTERVTDEWARAHAEFHRALISACPSPRLRDLADSMRETAELYRRWSGSFPTQQAPRDVSAELAAEPCVLAAELLIAVEGGGEPGPQRRVGGPLSCGDGAGGAGAIRAFPQSADLAADVGLGIEPRPRDSRYLPFPRDRRHRPAIPFSGPRRHRGRTRRTPGWLRARPGCPPS